MTLMCSVCESVDVVMFNDNGAEFPQTRVEFYECNECGHEFREVLVA